MYNPEEEGITHINAYSRSRTELGRLLSNFTKVRFTCEDGVFNSIEGYWYWLIAGEGEEREELRSLHGFRAKQRGRELCQGDWRDDKEFKTKIKRALWFKTKTIPRLKQLLLENTLPIVHYYEYGGNVIIPEHGEWIWEAFTIIKEHLLTKENNYGQINERPK